MKTLLIAASIALSSSATFAEERLVTITSEADWALCGISVAVARSNVWSEDLLEPYCLLTGESREITIDVGDDCLVDWRFILADYPDGPVTRRNFNVCEKNTNGFVHYILAD